MTDFAAIPEDQNPLWHARMAANLLDGMRKHNVDDPQIRALMIAEAQVHATLALRVEIPTATAEPALLEGAVGGGWMDIGAAVVRVVGGDRGAVSQAVGEVIEAHHAEGEDSRYIVRWGGGEILAHAENELAVIVF